MSWIENFSDIYAIVYKVCELYKFLVKMKENFSFFLKNIHSYIIFVNILMHSSKQATSVVEAMVVLLVIVTGVVGMYSIYIQSSRLSNSTAHKIQAIGIAREWIEAVINIRDTNWKVFWSDTQNCWNTLNYNTSCIWNTSTTSDITSGSYIVYKEIDHMWRLLPRSSGSYSGSYIDSFDTGFAVWIDADGFYTQSWWLSVSLMNPRYTREIQISYPGWDSNTDQINITSLVQWKDNVSDVVHDVELDVVLGNWE